MTPATSTQPIAAYLEELLQVKIAAPALPPGDSDRGIDCAVLSDAAAPGGHAGGPAAAALRRLLVELRSRRIGGIVLPNTRWFEGEERCGATARKFLN